MSQLVTQTTTYGLNSGQYSISTLSSVGGVLEIMAGNPHDEATAPTPIVDFKSDKSVTFYGVADLSNGVTLPQKIIGTNQLADKSVTSGKIADNVTIVGTLTGTASKATADGEGNNIVNTYATKDALTTVENKLPTYATKASPTFTGTVTIPTPSTSDNSTKAASTAYVKANLANYLTLSTEQSVTGKKTFSNITINPLLNFYKSGYSLNMNWNATETMGHIEFTSHGKSKGVYLALEKNDGSTWNRILTDADYSTIQQQTVPTGTILPFCGSSAPSGFLICNGGAVNRTTYSALFKLIGTKYGEGDGSTTFNLPNMHHRFLEGTTTTSEVNTYVGAGLPNITGEFGANEASGDYASGAFYISNTNNRLGSGDSDSDNDTVVFNASRSSKIYGASTTVQPNSTRVLFIVKY